MAQTKDKITSLHKQNYDLKDQIENLKKDFKKFDTVYSKEIDHYIQKRKAPSENTELLLLLLFFII